MPLISIDNIKQRCIDNGFHVSSNDNTDTYRNINVNIRKNNHRIDKWLEMEQNWDTFTSTKKKQLKSSIRKGIPAQLRAKIWKKLLGVDWLSKKQKLYYLKLRRKNPNPKFKKTIDADIHRTFPNHVLFSNDSNARSCRGTNALRNVLYAYSNHDTVVGYTQGMGFIVGIFLMLMTEVETFWCFCRLLDDNGSFGMRGLYCDGLPLLHLQYFQFDQLLNRFSPNLHKHLNSFDITPDLYTANWFLTIFCRQFPINFVHRIWDIYLSEGHKFIFRISLALLTVNSKELLKIKQFDVMLRYLLDLHKNCEDVDILLNESFFIAIKHKHLENMEIKYYNQQQCYQHKRSNDQLNQIQNKRMFIKKAKVNKPKSSYKSDQFHFV